MELIRARVRDGVALARKKHEHRGRPVKIFDRQKVLRLHREGKSTREIAKAVGVGKDTIHILVRSAT